MPLLDLKTDLKSLKYGADRPGGGDSGLPYIKTDINRTDQSFEKLRLTKFDDGLIRGGAIGAINASVTDTIRITKFLTDFPKGPLFITKQIGLQLSNPKLETRTGITGFFQSQPTRIYNLGLNTLAQIPINAFGGHFNRHGLLPVQNENTKYLAVVNSNNDLSINNIGTINKGYKNVGNRLLRLTTKFQLNEQISSEKRNGGTIGKTLNFINRVANSIGLNIRGLKPEQLIIDEYTGGASSVYGLGSTIINRYGPYTNDEKLIDEAIKKSGDAVKLAVTNLNQNLSRDLVGRGPSSYPKVPNPQIPNSVYGNLKTYKQISEKNTISNLGSKISSGGGGLFGISFSSSKTLDYKSNGNGKQPLSSSIADQTPVGEKLPSSTAYPSYTNAFGEKVTVNLPWNKVTREKRVGSGRRDIINLTPMFDESKNFGGDTIIINNDIRDLVRFRIQAVDTGNPDKGTWMVFRAYLTDLSDDISPDWSDVKYAGRGDKFYIYNGFSRKINVSFKVAALSKEEMKFIYQKLNFLMSNAMPDYEGVLMRGPLIRLSIGNWIDSQLGKIDNISFKVPQESPWEIALDEPEGGTKMLILPHIVEVSLGFTPIGSETKGNNLIPEKSTTTSNIAQNNTGNDIDTLQYITGSQ